MSKESFKHSMEVLYKMHDYDPKTHTKNIHHIIFKSDGGTNRFDNLSLVDIDLHNWIHHLMDKMDKHGGKLTKEEWEVINYLVDNDLL